VPVWHQRCALPAGLEYHLAGLQTIGFAEAEFDQALQQLLRALPAGPDADTRGEARGGGRGKRWRAAIAVGGAVLVGSAVPFLGRETIRWIQEASVAREIPDISGAWRAEVHYDWGANVEEVFRFRMDQELIFGTATYLEHPKGILDGRIEGERIYFLTKWVEVGVGAGERTVTNVYRGRISAGKIRFVMQDDRGYPPVEFVATRPQG
jgi:hypothetical protein